MIEIKDETEKVILVGVALSDQDDTKESLEELKDLVSKAVYKAMLGGKK